MIILSAVQVVVGGACAILMVAAALRAAPRLWKKVEARDLLLVVPDSGYFAPTPNTADYYLVARRAAGAPWHPVRTSHRRQRLAVVDPGRRARKALVDLGSMCVAIDSARRGRSVREARWELSTSVAYLVALNTCTAAVQATWSTVQFGLARLDHRDRRQVVDLIALSDVHPVHG